MKKSILWYESGMNSSGEDDNGDELCLMDRTSTADLERMMHAPLAGLNRPSARSPVGLLKSAHNYETTTAAVIQWRTIWRCIEAERDKTSWLPISRWWPSS